MAKPLLVICMGVAGSGKTTLAERIAARFAWRFIDADSFHSALARSRMASGIPLTDADRTPWMQRITTHLYELAGLGTHCVLAHSALRHTHREALRQCGFDACFLRLHCDAEILRARLERRESHFMPANLLASQMQAFEPTDGEADVVRLDAQHSPPRLVELAANIIATFRGSSYA